jgi:O-antigen/teichoic acid export membrane protein
VLLGYSVLGAVVATAVSTLVGAVAAIIIVYVALYRPIRAQKVGRCDIGKTLKPMLKYGLPLTVSSIVTGVVPSLFAFIMASNIPDNTIFGNYSAALNFAVLLTFISIPVSTVLFPAFAKLNPKEEPELLKTVFASSVKYTSVLLVPATFAIMVLAVPIVYTLYGTAYALAPLFLAIYVTINLYTLIGNISLATLLTGIGEAKQLMYQSILSLLFTLPLAFWLVPYCSAISPTMGIIGGIVGIILSSLPGTIWGLIWIWRHYNTKLDYLNSAKILLASGLAALVTYGFLTVFNVMAIVNLIIGFGVFLVIYLAAAPFVGAVNKADIDNFRSMFSGLGIVSRILAIPLRFMEKSLKIRQRNQTMPSENKLEAENAPIQELSGSP